MLKGGKSGPAIVPGKPDKSLLLKKDHVPRQMPPLRRIIEVSIKPIELWPRRARLSSAGAAGAAPRAAIAPNVATTKGDPLVSEKDRDFWSFRVAEAQVPFQRSSTPRG